MNYYNILEFVREEKDFFALYGYEGFETILKSIKNQIKLTYIPLNSQSEEMILSFPEASQSVVKSKKLLFGDKQVFDFINSDIGKEYRSTLSYYRGKGLFITLFHLMCSEFLQKQNNLDENSNNKVVFIKSDNEELKILQEETQRLRNENIELKNQNISLQNLNNSLTKDNISLREDLSSLMIHLNKTSENYDEEGTDNSLLVDNMDDSYDFDENEPFFNDEIPEDLDKKDIPVNKDEKSKEDFDDGNEEDLDIYSLMSKII